MRVLLPRGTDLLCPSARTRSCLRPAQLFLFLLLYVLALDSKEMAVTLPVIILIYEFLKAPRWADCKAFLPWSVHYATPSLVAGAVTVIYIYGKVYGTGSLTRLDPYRPRYSWHQFVAANAKFLNELFFGTMRLVQDILDPLGGCIRLCRLPAGPHGSTYGCLGSHSSSADSISSSDSRRWVSLPPAVRLGNDLCKSCL